MTVSHDSSTALNPSKFVADPEVVGMVNDPLVLVEVEADDRVHLLLRARAFEGVELAQLAAKGGTAGQSAPGQPVVRILGREGLGLQFD